MSRLFISHSSKDNVAAIAFKRWLGANDWPDEDVFLDLDSIGAGERWKEALRNANARCEAVILLASPEALDSPECVAEVRHAEYFGKEIIVVLLRDLQIDDRRLNSFKDRQIVNLSAPPQTHEEPVLYDGKQHNVQFNGEELAKIKNYLIKRGITPEHFPWPPRDKLNPEPFPGLSAFTEDDAGIFFGRDSDIVRGLDKLRVLRRNGRPRFMVIQAASGAGKSSYLRAGLWPRLSRDSDFAILAILRPAQGILTGLEGLGRKLAARLSRPGQPVSPGEIHAQLMARDAEQAAEDFKGMMVTVAKLAHEQRQVGDRDARPPAIILAIDQAEEMYGSENAAESERFLFLLASLMRGPPAAIELFVILTIRADGAARLFQTIADLKLEMPETLPLLPLPHTSYRDVILKPIEVLARRGQRLTVDPALPAHLVADATGADALPLLAFTISHLYREFSATGSLTLQQYEDIGGVTGSIDMALKQALGKPGDAPAIPAAKDEQLAQLRAAFIPWLARIDPDTNLPRRRVARLDEFPQHTRAMVERLVEARLLVADRRAGADVVEVAHESLLRQWPALAAWLQADGDDLKLVEAVERAAADWVHNGLKEAWLDHRGERLSAAERALTREDFSKRLGEDGVWYLNACRLLASMRISRLKLSSWLFVAMTLFAMTLGSVMDPYAVSLLRERTFDTYQLLQPRAYGEHPVLVADIDEASLAALGQWPWPRTRLATLVERLNDMGAAVIGFHLIFAEPDRTSPNRYASELLGNSDDANARSAREALARLPDNDQVFAAALKQAPVVLSFFAEVTPNAGWPPLKAEVEFDSASPISLLAQYAGALTNLPAFDDAASGIGAANHPADRSGTLRHLPMVLSDGSKVYPALVVEALRVAQKQRLIFIHGAKTAGNDAPLDLRVGNLHVPLADDGRMRLYYDHNSPDRYVSVNDVLDKDKDAIIRPHVNGRIVLVGTTAVGLAGTSISSLNEIVPDVGVLAQAVEQILGQAFLTRPDWAHGLEIAATFLLAAFIGFLMLANGRKFALIIGVAVIGVMVVGCWFAFINFKLLLDPIYPAIAAICVYLAAEATLSFANDSEKEIIRQAFRQKLASGWTRLRK